MANQPEFLLAGVIVTEQLTGKDTGGSFSMFENRSTGPSRTPIHVHANEDESLYVLAGQMTATLAGVEHTLGAGESIFLPRGTPHQLMNVSGGPAHYLLLCVPSGFEGFLAEGGRLRAPGEEPKPPAAAEIARMQAAAPRYGITLLPGW